jgi:hypothetical protein
MKRIVETSDGGFEGALGTDVCLICGVYIYSGKLSGVNDDHVELKNAVLVYETGDWNKSGWTDAQKLPGSVWRVQKSQIESWGEGK